MLRAARGRRWRSRSGTFEARLHWFDPRAGAQNRCAGTHTLGGTSFDAATGRVVLADEVGGAASISMLGLALNSEWPRAYDLPAASQHIEGVLDGAAAIRGIRIQEVVDVREGDWVEALLAGDPSPACTLFQVFGSGCLPCATDGQSYCVNGDHIKQVAAYDPAVPEMAVVIPAACAP